MRQIEIATGQGRPLFALFGAGERGPQTIHNQRLVEEPAEREPVPYVTYVLTAINVIVFLMMMAVGRHGDNIDSVAEMFGAKVNVLIQHGQWWRLITPIFLHGSLLHLGSNLLSLVWFGRGIERLYGARKYLLIYFVAGVAGNIASYIHMPGLSLGASGAIFGLVGAGLMFPIRFRSLLPADAPSQILGQILPIAAINLFIGFTTPSIDNWAHMGGLAGGAIVALFLMPDAIADRRPHPALNAFLSVACACVVLITLLAGFKQWQWAMMNPPLDPYRIGSKDDLWWHVGIPTDWKSADGVLTWKAPDGTRLHIADSGEDPQLPEEVRAVSERAKPNVTVDGHAGWQVQASLGNDRSDLFLVPVYDRVVAFMFQPPTTPKPRYVNSINQILRSVHFDHAPAPLAAPPNSP